MSARASFAVFAGTVAAWLLMIAVSAERLELSALADGVTVVCGAWVIAYLAAGATRREPDECSCTDPSRASRAPVTEPCATTHGQSRVDENVQVTGSSGRHGYPEGWTPSRTHEPVTGADVSAGQATHGSITGVTHGSTHGSPPLPIGGDRVQGS